MRFSILIFLALWSFSTQARTSIWIEQGPVFQSKNTFSIPSASGTRINLADTSKGPYHSGRLEGRYDFNEHHALRFLFAPFLNETSFRANSAFQFQDTVFTANQLLKASFMFNSYRVSYLYTFNPGSEWTFSLGFTGKIRHAKISLTDGITTAEKPNVGFVPLLYFSLVWRPAELWELTLVGDALAAPQGRAEDVLLKASYSINENWSAYAGYRMLEGGADNDTVYTFSWFHYAVIGIVYSL